VENNAIDYQIPTDSSNPGNRFADIWQKMKTFT